MNDQNIRMTTRRVIFMALSVWLVSQALFYLEPFGAPAFLSSSLTFTGFIALPALAAWPMIRRYVLNGGSHKPSSIKSTIQERRSQLIISAEIAALSTMLIYLISQRPQ